jgi:hypothetical protein
MQSKILEYTPGIHESVSYINWAHRLSKVGKLIVSVYPQIWWRHCTVAISLGTDSYRLALGNVCDICAVIFSFEDDTFSESESKNPIKQLLKYKQRRVLSVWPSDNDVTIQTSYVIGSSLSESLSVSTRVRLRVFTALVSWRYYQIRCRYDKLHCCYIQIYMCTYKL